MIYNWVINTHLYICIYIYICAHTDFVHIYNIIWQDIHENQPNSGNVLPNIYWTCISSIGYVNNPWQPYKRIQQNMWFLSKIRLIFIHDIAHTAQMFSVNPNSQWWDDIFPPLNWRTYEEPSGSRPRYDDMSLEHGTICSYLFS